MISKKLFLIIIFGLFLTAAVFAFADTPTQEKQNMLFSQGVGCYKHKNYYQAKLLFVQLDQLHDRRAKAWLSKVDRVITRLELLTIQKLEGQHKEELQAKAKAKAKALEDERQAGIKAEAEMKVENARAQAERSAHEKEHREDIMRQEAQERQSQVQLEIRREALRKQLEEGVDAMYRDALNLYKLGDYLTAADRFKDVQDILPGYKDSERYMDDARQKSLTIKPRDNVSKALDIFDPNAK
jgi:TolA-binding protein